MLWLDTGEEYNHAVLCFCVLERLIRLLLFFSKDCVGVVFVLSGTSASQFQTHKEKGNDVTLGFGLLGSSPAGPESGYSIVPFDAYHALTLRETIRWICKMLNNLWDTLQKATFFIRYLCSN